MLLPTDAERIDHMIAAIEEILEYIQGKTLENVAHNRPLEHLLVRNIEILGEAANRTTRRLREKYPAIPWRNMVSMRNRVVHAYHDIDLYIVWSTAINELPPLLPLLRAMAAELKRS